MREWQKMELGEVMTLQRGYDLTERDRKPGSVPVVSSSGVSGYHNEAKVSGPGVITGRYGTLGDVYYIEGDFWPHNTTLFVKDFHGNDRRFAYYLLGSLNLANRSAVSAVPGVNRNDLHRLPVLRPPLPTQRRIAEILGRLDDKIEMNRRTNRTLEAMAQALFKYHFVEFGPYQDDLMESKELGLIPKGWEVKSLDEIAGFLNGLALQKYPAENDEDYLPVIKIAEMRRGITEASGRANLNLPSQYIVEDGDVLFSWSGSLLVSIWAHGPGALNQHLFKVTSLNYPKWFYYHWLQHHLLEFQAIAAGKATTMGHIQRYHLSDAKVVVPPEDIFEVLDQSMTTWLNLFINNELENRKLAETRAYLLPRLLSGEVGV